MTSEVTVVIVARNAEDTISRAVLSASEEIVKEILVIDDLSEDDSAKIAIRAGGEKVRVERPLSHHTLGSARQYALNCIETPIAVFLDADDALLPGRIKRLTDTMMTTEADIVFDSLELYDGTTNRYLRELPIPSFLLKRGADCRLFERNYLPGISQMAIKTDIARSLGYDCDLHGVEDTDFILRAVAKGLNIRCNPQVGYRMYSYPTSVSRNLARQRSMLANLLRKHEYTDVAELYKRSGFSEKVMNWGLCSMAMFRGEWNEALNFLERACDGNRNMDDILEPNGPYPVPEGWRYGFSKGTLLLFLNRPQEALELLESTFRWRESPDAYNNLGIAHFRSGETKPANSSFESALRLCGGYHDAIQNLKNETPVNITTHPLRMQASRSEY